MQIFHRKWIVTLGLLPALAIYTLFTTIPIGVSVYFSFFKWDGFSTPIWIGLKNYIVLAQDSVFWNSIKNNLYFVFSSIFFQVPLALYLAIILNGKIIRRNGIFKTVFFMPVVISTLVLALIGNMMLNYQIGLINALLRVIGLENLTQNWLGIPQLAILLLCIIVVWQYVGLHMVIFLAALQSVSSEVLEAAEIDGATGMKRTWFITIPMIMETIFASVILCIGGSLRTFEIVFVTTNGGPNHATDVAATYMFNQAFSSMKFGYGNAISFVSLIISFFLIMVSYFFVKKLKR